MDVKIEELLKMGLEKRASDLHILPKMQPLLRIDGELIPVDNTPVLTATDTKDIIYRFMSEAQQATFENASVIDMSLSLPNIGNFRVSVLHQMHGIAAVLRLLPAKVPTFDELGVPQTFKRLMQLTQGLILVVGATGSGKSTTMAAMLEQMNTSHARHIITIDDPIEYIYETKKCAITQLQVGRDTPNYAQAVHAALRQDPDVIFIGEMRDLETVNLGLIAAETGHLVVGTLHASSAPMAISRVVDMFPLQEKNRVRGMLSETIQAVVCQALVRKKTPGRIAAYEIMLATPAIRHLIHQDLMGQMESTMQTSGDVGMCTMEQYLQELVNKQLITSTTARSVIAARRVFQ